METQINQIAYGQIQSTEVDGQTRCEYCDEIIPNETFCPSEDCIRSFLQEIIDRSRSSRQGMFCQDGINQREKIKKQINQIAYDQIQSVEVDGQTRCQYCDEIIPRHETFCSDSCIGLFFAKIGDVIHFAQIKINEREKMQKQINQTTYSHIQSTEVAGQTHCEYCDGITPNETFCPSEDCIRSFLQEIIDRK